jgi:ABC-type glycerol-3-phosphate transport system substrate-binding protein
MKKNFVLYGLAGLVLLALAMAALVVVVGRPPQIGFYAADAASIVAIKSLASSGRFSGLGFEFVDMESPEGRGLPLSGKGAPVLLFSYDGLLSPDDVARLEGLAAEPAQAMPSSLRRVGLNEDRRYAYPLAIDHFELAYDKALFAGKGLAAPVELKVFLDTAAGLSRPGAPAIFCAGGDDAVLLNLVGALAEARGGAAAAEALAALEYTDGMLGSILDQSLGLDGAGSPVSLRTELELLVSLKAAGILHPEWFRFKARDLAAFMDGGMAPFVLMMLSGRRLLDQRLASRYQGSLFPAAEPGAARAPRFSVLIATVNAAAPKRHKDAAKEFLAYMVSAPGQRQLAGANGLAPAHASAETLDEQASELRLWAAASRLVLPEPGWALTHEPRFPRYPRR